MDNKKRSKKTVADTVCRVHKFGGYAVLSNCFVRSTNLGCPAIGLLGRVLDLPPEWNFTKAGLIAVCADGETAVESALANLEKWGYVKKTKSAVAAETEKSDIPTVKNLAQLKRSIKPGMMFEITDHLRPERIGERRVVTGVNSVEFTSQKLDENGEPSGKDIHMEFDRAKNWSFDAGKLTSHLNDGRVLMSFHFVDDTEKATEKTIKENDTVEEMPQEQTVSDGEID